MKHPVLWSALAASLLGGAHCAAPADAPPAPASSVADVRFVTEAADAVLAILDRISAGQPVRDEDWHRLASSEPYIRLKAREAAMQRPFDDAEFKSFVLSEELAGRRVALADTLTAWAQADVEAATRRALAYLPAGAAIRAKIYPMIKPRENSFVFEVDTDPAIFLFIDPKMSTAQLENTLAHELHHIGYGGSCPPARAAAEVAKLPERARSVVRWIGAFGEGLAMLAAAGGPQIHPHAASAPEDRARWDRDLAGFADDLKQVERFFLDILDNRLSDEQAQREGFAFFGVQGPWYTVGWRMAATIEQNLGRARLIEVTCDMRTLPAAYNEAARASAGEPTAVWSAALLEAIHGPSD